MLAITLGYGLIYTCRLALGVVKKPLIDAGVFSPNDLGLIGSALFYTYAIGKLTNGFLADHANIKRFLAFAFLMTALCNLAMGFATTLWLAVLLWGLNGWRSEEHTSELQSLMRISYAVFCLKKKKNQIPTHTYNHTIRITIPSDIRNAT